MGIFSKKDNREFARVDREYMVSYAPKKSSSSNNSLTKNISANGVLIEAKEPLPLNSILYLTLNLPRYGEVILEGQVVWCKKQEDKYHAGIGFFNIDKENQDLILKALSEKH